jgi:hypothetical protein
MYSKKNVQLNCDIYNWYVPYVPTGDVVYVSTEHYFEAKFSMKILLIISEIQSIPHYEYSSSFLPTPA